MNFEVLRGVYVHEKYNSCTMSLAMYNRSLNTDPGHPDPDTHSFRLPRRLTSTHKKDLPIRVTRFGDCFTELSFILGNFFSRRKLRTNFDKKTGWAPFWSNFSQTHPVTLLPMAALGSNSMLEILIRLFICFCATTK
jgi:hypothetical protein